MYVCMYVCMYAIMYECACLNESMYGMYASVSTEVCNVCMGMM